MLRILFLLLPFFLSAQTIIFVYGTSCAGKSTLSKSLFNHLGEEWKLIDCDEVDDPSYSIKEALNDQWNVIVDTQLHAHLREEFQEHETISILVFAPLSVLIERDERRNKHLHRSPLRQKYARAFIYETYEQLYDEEAHPREPCDIFVNSGEKSVQAATDNILDKLRSH